MKELDIVQLIKDFQGIKSGTIGTIVYEHDGAAFEVEFFDNNLNTIDVITTPADMLELIESFHLPSEQNH